MSIEMANEILASVNATRKKLDSIDKKIDILLNAFVTMGESTKKDL